MDLDPGRMGLCHNFLLIASSYEASRYVQEQVAYWREHRGMQFFHILDTVGGAHEANENWPDDLPYNTSYHPRDGLPAAIWGDAILDSPEGVKRLASSLTKKMTRREVATQGGAPRSALKIRWLQPRTLLGALVGILLLALLTIAWISTRGLLESHQEGGLGPTDAPATVASIVNIGTVIGVLIGGILTGPAKLIQAHGQKDADLIRAKAEMLRAEADMVRAKAGLPPTDAPVPISLPSPGEAEQPA